MRSTPIPVLLVQLSRRFGGADVRVLEMARALQQRRWPYQVAVLAGSRLHRLLQEESLASAPIPLRRGDPRQLWRLVQLIRRHDVQVVDAHNPQSQLWGTLAAAVTGVPVCIATVHTVYRVAHVGKGRRHELALRLARRLGARFICVSLSIHDYLLSLGVDEDKLTLSYNGLRPIIPAPTVGIRQALGWRPDQPVVIVVARLSPVKGHVYLLQALQSLRREYPDLRCLLVGDGELRPMLQKEAGKLGVEEMVWFAGFRQDVSALMAESDLFCLPSLAEGFPFSVIEAAQHKLPMVVTYVDGMLEHLQPDIHAWLVPAGDAEALADALRWWLTHRDEGRQLGMAARRLIRERFDPERMVLETLQVYRETTR